MTATLFDTAPAAYFAFDSEARVVVVNQTLLSTLEKTESEIILQRIETILTVPSRIFFETHFFPLMKMQGHAEEIFLSLLGAHGKHLPVLLNANTATWEAKKVICCSCIFVPNRNKFEDELVLARKTAENALEQNSELLKARAALKKQTKELDRKLQMIQMQNLELRQFSHAVTHNLREPLRKILIYTEKLESETTAASITNLKRANEQMKGVVSGLQQYVWLNEKTNDYTQVDLNSVLEEVKAQLNHELSPSVFVIEHTTLPIIEGDKDQLKMLLYHLLSNAVKFRKSESSHITVEGIILKKNRFRWVENTYLYEDFARVEVIDDGIGFPSTYANTIFELFRKAHSTGGQGVGLALCKKIVENHQGHIEAESELNKFTKITLWLPCFQSSPR